MNKEYFVYILLCSDDSYYTGVTNNFEYRFAQHQEGTDESCYTYKRRPLQLVCTIKFEDIKQAIAWEKQIKGWTRKKKQALIEENWNKLKELAVCKNDTSHKNYNRE